MWDRSRYRSRRVNGGMAMRSILLDEIAESGCRGHWIDPEGVASCRKEGCELRKHAGNRRTLDVCPFSSCGTTLA